MRISSDDTFTDNMAFENGKLTRMFDGCKPSSGWRGNVDGVDPDYPATIGCGPDGIERLSVPSFSGKTLEQCSAPVPDPAPVPTSDKVIVGYYPQWAMYRTARPTPITDTPNTITHMNYAFFNVKNGECVAFDSSADSVHFPEMRRFKEENPHVKLMVSLGGWTLSAGFSQVRHTSSLSLRGPFHRLTPSISPPLRLTRFTCLGCRNRQQSQDAC